MTGKEGKLEPLTRAEREQYEWLLKLELKLTLIEGVAARRKKRYPEIHNGIWAAINRVTRRRVPLGLRSNEELRGGRQRPS
jgi:hypothetical protein